MSALLPPAPRPRRRKPRKGRALLEALERGDRELPSAEERWRALLLDPHPLVRLAAEKFLFSVTHGLPSRAAPLPAAGAGDPVTFAELAVRARTLSDDELDERIALISRKGPR